MTAPAGALLLANRFALQALLQYFAVDWLDDDELDALIVAYGFDLHGRYVLTRQNAEALAVYVHAYPESPAIESLDEWIARFYVDPAVRAALALSRPQTAAMLRRRVWTGPTPWGRRRGYGEE